jgi:hypothetical protein
MEGDCLVKVLRQVSVILTFYSFFSCTEDVTIPLLYIVLIAMLHIQSNDKYCKEELKILNHPPHLLFFSQVWK